MKALLCLLALCSSTALAVDSYPDWSKEGSSAFVGECIKVIVLRHPNVNNALAIPYCRCVLGNLALVLTEKGYNSLQKTNEATVTAILVAADAQCR